MKNKRLTGFMLAILLGLVLGLVYGWVLNPADAKNTRLSSLRSDYQADYVLMVAEKFTVDQDALSAVNLLRSISPADPYAAIRQALILGQQLEYSERELQTISALEAALTTAGEAAP